MQKTRFSNSLSLFLCIVLIAAMALITSGCKGNNNSNAEPASTVETSDAATVSETTNILGEGEKQFYFTVTKADGTENSFEIHTDKTTVGEALMELDLIAGEESEYGLYVKTVNGITVDYDKDGKYWAFYVNGEYATSGVDTTEITDGASYEFKAE